MEGTLVDLPRILELKEIYKVGLSQPAERDKQLNAIPSSRSVLSVYRRGPLSRSSRAPGTRRLRLLFRRPSPCRHFDGNFHQVCVPVPLSFSFSLASDPVSTAFGAAGGYIAGAHTLIQSLRLSSHSENYAEAMPPPIVSQIITSTGSIMGPEAFEYVPSLATLPLHLMDGVQGRDRLQRLAFNCRYLSGGLKKLGFIVYGHRDSPIVPMLVYAPGKMGPFSRLMLERHKIMYALSFFFLPAFGASNFVTDSVSSLPPASSSSLTPRSPSFFLPAIIPTRTNPSPHSPRTPLVSGRVRFCLSAAHTKADLDQLLRATDDVGGILGLKLAPSGERMDIEEVIRTGVEMVRATERE